MSKGEFMRVERLSVVWCTLIFLTNIANAQDSAREQQTKRIIAQYLGKPVTPDSPIVRQALAEARAINSNATEEVWCVVANDLAATLSDEMTGKGSPGFESVAVALKQLSDSEVRRLDELFSDPVYRKFQSAMSSAPALDALANGVYRSSLSAHSAVEGVLRRHNLKF
jgi:hypothetical protein